MSIFLGRNRIQLPSIGSTNDYMNQLFEQRSLDDGTIVVTTSQTDGKGQRNNLWESEPGKNLTFSVLLYPGFIPPDEQFSLSMAVSLGIFDYLNTLLVDVKIKWPNDILVDGRKICGILIENAIRGNAISHSIVGIGLNVNQVIFSQKVPHATSMKLRGAREFDLDLTLNTLLVFIENRYVQLNTEWSECIRRDYLDSLYGFNEFRTFEHRNKKFLAKIVNVESSGRLILELQSGETLGFYFKEVTFCN